MTTNIAITEVASLSLVDKVKFETSIAKVYYYNRKQTKVFFIEKLEKEPLVKAIEEFLKEENVSFLEIRCIHADIQFIGDSIVDAVECGEAAGRPITFVIGSIYWKSEAVSRLLLNYKVCRSINVKSIFTCEPTNLLVSNIKAFNMMLHFWPNLKKIYTRYDYASSCDEEITWKGLSDLAAILPKDIELIIGRNLNITTTQELNDAKVFVETLITHRPVCIRLSKIRVNTESKELFQRSVISLMRVLITMNTRPRFSIPASSFTDVRFWDVLKNCVIEGELSPDVASHLQAFSRFIESLPQNVANNEDYIAFKQALFARDTDEDIFTDLYDSNGEYSFDNELWRDEIELAKHRGINFFKDVVNFA